MPRMGRIVLPNYPHHVVQRGHNRQVVFAAESDYREMEKWGQIYFLEKWGQIYFSLDE